MNSYRQGDVLLKPIEKLPEKAKKLKTKIVAEGEVTGHSHRFNDETTELYLLNGIMYAQVPFTTEIIHEDHKPLKIEKGIYEVGREREWDYFDAEMKLVKD